jgi:hypothetical protein
MAQVSVVIPTWNRRDLLERALDDLGRQTRAPNEILVVDNGSGDGSALVAAQRGARVLEMGWNAGFSRAVNRGVRESRHEWVAILNNDVQLESNWLERLLGAATEWGAWFATGKILRGDGRLDATFDAVARSGCAWRCGGGRLDGPEWSSGREIWSAPFTAALFRRELFDLAGPLDEEFGTYLEDVEFGLRCRLRGCSGRYVPEAVAYHEGSSTWGRWDARTVRSIARNQVLLVAGYYPAGWWKRLGWPVLVGQLLWGLVAVRHHAGLAWWSGKLEGLRQARKRRGMRREEPGIAAALERGEALIRELQGTSGFDLYWRLYFALT